MRAVLAIAGLDSSGGAGLARDVATITGMGLHAKVAATAVTAQSLAAVRRVVPLAPELVAAQIAAAFEDLAPAAVKVGMLGTPEVAAAVAQALAQAHARNVVVDPVLASTSGTSLLAGAPGEKDAESGASAASALASLFRLAALVTPNVPEAEALLGRQITDRDKMAAAAADLLDCYGCAVLLKGGHLGLADDCLASAEGITWVGVPVVAGGSAHGTGCMLSSAIAAGLATGQGLEQAVRGAKLLLARGLAGRVTLPQGAYLHPPGCWPEA
ncbi:MAG: hydroxymethylpyrimidine/phosphomethylpyrimidine kinase [Olsenella sp.]|jgi:hydroxymethylpyrimidine kinase/phosphomethylpyrimidine kinase|nr:hydroxymethylpyrimidine/phosphomethylpyrimidine kinase [Olsenella sp.]MCI1289012.1 hydroxymethylpyrimidine/phosphomethylpyrimidine kinase [Olsenella sp.]